MGGSIYLCVVGFSLSMAVLQTYRNILDMTCVVVGVARHVVRFSNHGTRLKLDELEGKGGRSSATSLDKESMQNGGSVRSQEWCASWW